MIEITAENIEEVMSNKKVVVDFMADWCAPCKQMAPVFEKLSEDPNYSDIVFAKYDIEKGLDLTSKAGIRSVPAFVFFVDGEAANSVIGSMKEDKLKEFIENGLNM